jgi:6-phosphogluconate dehydrogenase
VWRRHSIIRGDWIDELLSRPDGSTFEVGDLLHKYLGLLPSLRKAVSIAMCNGYAMPCHAASLSFLDSILLEKTWIPLVAAQRDYFGGHGFKLEENSMIQRWNW